MSRFFHFILYSVLAGVTFLPAIFHVYVECFVHLALAICALIFVEGHRREQASRSIHTSQPIIVLIIVDHI